MTHIEFCNVRSLCKRSPKWLVNDFDAACDQHLGQVVRRHLNDDVHPVRVTPWAAVVEGER